MFWEKGGLDVAGCLAFTNNLNLLLCNVGLVNRKLRLTTKSHLGRLLRGVAGGHFLTMLINFLVAALVRDSSTAAIVIINFIGANLVGLARTVNIVVNTGVNAAAADILISLGLAKVTPVTVFVNTFVVLFTGGGSLGCIKRTLTNFNVLFVNVRLVRGTVSPLGSSRIFHG